MNRILVAFSGKAGSGKSTFAKRLKEDFDFQIVSIASPIKKIVQEYFPSIDALPKNVRRKAYQKIGSAFRSIDKNVWVRIVLIKVEEIQGNVVVDDLRYLNELYLLKKHGFITIRLKRAKRLRLKAGYDVFDQHESEVELDNYPQLFDYILINDDPYPFDRTYKLIKFILGLENES